MPKESNRYLVQSVDRAVDILETLASATRAFSLSEIAIAVSGSKSAVFSMLQTLAARGMVRSIGLHHSRQYCLGLRLARLGDLAIGQVSFHDAALVVLARLSADTGLTSRAAAWDDDCAVAIARVSGASGLELGLRMGNRELLHCTGVGKAILFTLPDESVRSLLSTIPLTPRTSHTLARIDALLADLEASRSRGYAIDDEEDADGIICIGAPVFDHDGATVGAVSVTRIKSAITPEEVAALGRATARHARDLSGDLGWTGPTLDAAGQPCSAAHQVFR
jgi:IclR family acetate operon transcriptional repressor